MVASSVSVPAFPEQLWLVSRRPDHGYSEGHGLIFPEEVTVEPLADDACCKRTPRRSYSDRMTSLDGPCDADGRDYRSMSWVFRCLERMHQQQLENQAQLQRHQLPSQHHSQIAAARTTRSSTVSQFLMLRRLPSRTSTKKDLLPNMYRNRTHRLQVLMNTPWRRARCERLEREQEGFFRAALLCNAPWRRAQCCYQRSPLKSSTASRRTH